MKSVTKFIEICSLTHVIYLGRDGHAFKKRGTFGRPVGYSDRSIRHSAQGLMDLPLKTGPAFFVQGDVENHGPAVNKKPAHFLKNGEDFGPVFFYHAYKFP